jgi:hypothetical protein
MRPAKSQPKTLQNLRWNRRKIAGVCYAVSVNRYEPRLVDALIERKLRSSAADLLDALGQHVVPRQQTAYILFVVPVSVNERQGCEDFACRSRWRACFVGRVADPSHSVSVERFNMRLENAGQSRAAGPTYVHRPAMRLDSHTPISNRLPVAQAIFLFAHTKCRSVDPLLMRCG